ncbi:MAG: hypothetical protein AAGE38_10270 [Pseudomonadota bacterium]
MSIAAQISVALGAIAVMLGLMAVVRRMARQRGLSAEVQRKLVHIGTGLFALTLPWLFPDRWPVFMLIALTLITMAVLRLPRFARSGLGAALHGVERRSYGDVLLALAVGFVYLMADGRAILYVLPLAVLTLSDAAAALTGSRYGSQFFRVEDGVKSLEGSVAFFTVTLILSMSCLLLLSDVPRQNILPVAVMVAGFATLIEADSWRGFDNFFLPAGLLLFLERHLTSTPLALFGILVLLTCAIILSLGAARYLGLTAHAARVYVLSAFLLISVTTVQNVILPLSVFAAHAISCRHNPCSARYPELDIVAGLAVISFAWLAAGALSGQNNLSFYGMSAAGLSLGLLAVAAAPGKRWIELGFAALGVLAAYFVLMRWNPDATHWAGSLEFLALGSAVILSLIPAAQSAAFQNARALKLSVISMLGPCAVFLAALGRARGWLG